MTRTRYLVCYDIRDSGRLRRVHKVMLAFGAPLQYSVFVCDLTAGELVDLRLDISSVTNLGLDSVMIVPLGAGYDASVIEFMGARRDLPSGGPSII